MQIVYTLLNIENAVKEFWQIAQNYRVITFNGGLGAGKTTFTHALCQFLGVQDAVSSPTFSIINEYGFIGESGSEVILFHSDWYRLRDEEEAINAGVEDMLQQVDAYCIVEWAAKAPGLLPAKRLDVDFELLDEHTRRLSLHPNP